MKVKFDHAQIEKMREDAIQRGKQARCSIATNVVNDYKDMRMYLAEHQLELDFSDEVCAILVLAEVLETKLEEIRQEISET